MLNQDSGAKNLEVLMGKAKASELQKKFTITLEALNEIVVMFPKFLPALVEKSKVRIQKKKIFIKTTSFLIHQIISINLYFIS